MLIKEFLIMDYLITMDTGERFIAHYGVKGQKWGVWNPETTARYNGNKNLTVSVGGGGGENKEIDEELKDELKKLADKTLSGEMTEEERMKAVNAAYLKKGLKPPYTASDVSRGNAYDTLKREVTSKPTSFSAEQLKEKIKDIAKNSASATDFITNPKNIKYVVDNVVKEAKAVDTLSRGNERGSVSEAIDRHVIPLSGQDKVFVGKGSYKGTPDGRNVAVVQEHDVRYHDPNGKWPDVRGTSYTPITNKELKRKFFERG